MYTVSFLNSRKAAFFHGFVKGLAAPVHLFNSENAPALPPIAKVDYRGRSPMSAMRSDWKCVGNAVEKVANEHQSQTADD